MSALIRANAPALTKLDVYMCGFGEAGFAPIFDALPRNTHLEYLSCHDGGDADLSEGFLRSRVLPAMLANSSLRYAPEVSLLPNLEDEMRALFERHRLAALA